MGRGRGAWARRATAPRKRSFPIERGFINTTGPRLQNPRRRHRTRLPRLLPQTDVAFQVASPSRHCRPLLCLWIWLFVLIVIIFFLEAGSSKHPQVPWSPCPALPVPLVMKPSLAPSLTRSLSPESTATRHVAKKAASQCRRATVSWT